MKKLFTLAFLLSIFMQTMAQSFADWTDDEGTNWFFIILPGDTVASIYDTSKKKGNLVIPSKVYQDEMEYRVTGIGGPNRISGFTSCSEVSSLTIPSSVTQFYDRSISGLNNLKKVIVPDISAWCKIAFASASESNPLSRAHHLYSDENTEITNLVIPEGVQYIMPRVFFGCTGLTSVTIPNSVTSIGSNAFSGCTGLNTAFIGSGIKNIGSIAFSNCSNLNDVYCLAYRYPTTDKDAFSNSYPDYITLHVPDDAVGQYSAVEPWSTFKVVVGLAGSSGATPCAKPTIGYKNGQITTDCETDGAQCVTIITVDDAKTYITENINLSVTYNISVYATKPGYDNSEIATATLCWIDVEPQKEGFTDAVASIKATPVLIQSENGRINISGADEGTQIYVFNVSGQKVASATIKNNEANIFTDLQPGNVALIKIGNRSVKVIMK